jgi:hypothetical protein
MQGAPLMETDLKAVSTQTATVQAGFQPKYRAADFEWVPTLFLPGRGSGMSTGKLA